MRCKYIVAFFLILSLFSMHKVIIFASTETGFLQIDNHYKVAYPGELVPFNITIVSNGVNRETFLIHHVWEDSVLWLPMDLVDNQVYDHSPFRNHGAVYGATQVDGVFGKALSFDGVDDHIEVSHNASLALENDLTISVVIRPLAELPWDSYQGIIAKGLDWQTPGFRYRFEYGNPGGIQLFVSDGESVDSVNYNPSFDGTSFYHIAATVNGNVYKIYENGVLKNTNPEGSSILSASEHPLNIGTRGEGGPYFNGTIDEVHIFNRALTAKEIGWLYNHSWSESLSRYNVELGPGESTQVTFSVKVPEDAIAGHVQKFLLTAFSLSNPENVETQTVTVEVLTKYGAEISLDENEKKGKPGEILNFQAAIRNLGNIEDTYDIAAYGGEGWNLSLSAESVTVSAGVGVFNISVKVPLDAPPGDYTSFSIQAASRGDTNLTAHVEGTAVATAIYLFSITADPELRQSSPGSEAIFSLELKNLGTAQDTINLEIENLIGWDIEVDPTSLPLEIGETGKATVHVRVPKNTLIGQTSPITIRAVSNGDPEVSANSSISIEVVTPFWEMPDVRFIVGLFIGVLVGTTLTGSIILRRTKIIREENRGGVRLFPIHYLYKLTPFALIILSAVSAIFLSPILTLGVFGLTLAICILLKYDSRLLVRTAIFMIILSAAFLASGSSAGANEIALIAYYFLLIGVLGILIEYLSEGKTAK